MQKRQAVLPNDQYFQQLREICHSTRANALQKILELQQQLGKNCTKNGIYGCKELVVLVMD